MTWTQRRKIMAAIAGIVAVAALTVALVLGTIAAPDNGIVARVNGEEITAEELERAWTQYAHGGAELTRAQALDRLILEKLFYEEAELGGYVPTKGQAERELRDQLRRQGMTIEVYREALEDLGFSFDEYIEDLQRALGIAGYLDAATEVSEEEAREFYEELREEDEDLGPFEEEKAMIVAFLSQEKMFGLIQDAKANADIEIYI